MQVGAAPRAARPYGTLALGTLSLLIPFVNYGWRGDLTGGDAAIAWALPGEQLRQVAGVYLNGPGLGYNGATGLAAAFPALTIAAGLHATGISTAIVARLMIGLYYFVAMSGALKLFEAVLPQAPASRAAALLAALLYGINRYTVLLYFTAQTYFPLVYSALPWILYGVVVGCEGRRARGIAIVVAALVWAGGAGSNPALFGVALCALLCGAILEIAQRVSARRVLAVAGAGALLGLACDAWWILPLFTSLGAGLDTVSAAGVPDWAQWMSARSSFLNLFKLDGYTGVDVMPFAAWYASPLGSVLGYVPLAVAIAGFGVYRRRFSAAALLLFALAAFLSKGVHGPFGSVYAALLAHVPGFTIFRSPYVKWIALESLLLALLFALGSAGIVARASALGARRRVAVPGLLAAVLCAVVAFPWPAYAGRMLSPHYQDVGFLSTVPAAYARAAAIVEGQGGGRTIVFNPGARPYPLYTWGYFGDDPLSVALRGPVAPFDTVLQAAPQMSARALSLALRSLGVRFIAVHHDVRNVVPSPQASVLVRTGAAVPLLRSSDLDLYRLLDSSEPPAIALSAPLLAQASRAAFDDERIDALAGRLDPNAGLMVSGGPLAVLEPLSDADARSAQGLGWIRDVTDAVRDAPAAAHVAFVPGNPLAVVAGAARCGAHSALRLASPARWRLGTHALGAFAATLCLARPRMGGFVVAGALRDDGAAQTALVNGDPLDVAVEQSGPPSGVARRLMEPGLPFALTLPARAGALDLFLPASASGHIFYATLRAEDGAQLGYAGPARDGVIVMAGLAPAATDRRVRAYLATPDIAAFVALQNVGELPYGTVALAAQPFALHVDQGMLAAVDVTGARGGSVRALAATALTPASPRDLQPRWRPSAETQAAEWQADANGLRLRSHGTPTELHLEGTFAANTRYRVSLRYRATGYAELWIRIAGSETDRISHLRADGAWHALAQDIFPPAFSTGRYIVRLRSSAGSLEATDLRLRAEGPNGVALAWQPRLLGGRVVESSRPFPWLIALRVADCTPCAVRLDVADPRHWSIFGAVIAGRYTSQGGAGGPWGSITTGAATFLLRTAPGTHDVRALYTPALFAAFGLLLALLGLFVTIAQTVRAPRASPACATSDAPGSVQPRYAALAAFALATAATGGVLPEAGGLFADALWAALVCAALFEWTRRTASA